jgi:hypothetical protein
VVNAMSRLKETIIGIAIAIGAGIFLYVHQIYKVHLYTGEWHFDLFEYYKFRYGSEIFLLLIGVILVAYVLSSLSRKYNKKQ